MITRRTAILGAAVTVVAGTALYRVEQSSSYRELAESIRVPKSSLGDDSLSYLVHYATLAANSHNTQPWLFSASQKGLTIKPDLARATPAADPDHHHLFASLGCACENLVLAARAAGTNARPTFIDEDDGYIDITLSPGSRTDSLLFDAIPARQCTRSLYDGRSVNAADLEALQASAKVEGCRVILIPDRAIMEQILELVIAANTAQVHDPAFTRELKSWLRFSAADAIERRDGLYSACAGNPSMPSWLGEIFFDLAFEAEAENDRYAEQIRSSSGLAVFVSEKDDKAHWVQAGRSYQRFALQATSLGLRHAFVNQPVEVAAFRPELAKLLGVGPLRPDLVLRYGYAPAMPQSLRRPLADVIVKS